MPPEPLRSQVLHLPLLGKTPKYTQTIPNMELVESDTLILVFFFVHFWRSLQLWAIHFPCFQSLGHSSRQNDPGVPLLYLPTPPPESPETLYNRGERFPEALS
jgi:hypothetical protein